MLPHNPLSPTRQCYFSLVPQLQLQQSPASPNNNPLNTTNHWSDETPLASPTFDPSQPSPADPLHPLLASRENPIGAMASSIMQKQTTAAHPSSPAPTHRQRPSLQNVLQVTSDDSASSSSSLDTTPSSPAFARCSRCQRTPSLDWKTGKSNMVQYGLNLWYCTRCAAMVGLQIDR